MKIVSTCCNSLMGPSSCMLAYLSGAPNNKPTLKFKNVTSVRDTSIVWHQRLFLHVLLSVEQLPTDESRCSTVCSEELMCSRGTQWSPCVDLISHYIAQLNCLARSFAYNPFLASHHHLQYHCTTEVQALFLAAMVPRLILAYHTQQQARTCGCFFNFQFAVAPKVAACWHERCFSSC